MGEQNTDPVQPATWQRVTAFTVSAVPDGLCVDGYLWNLTVEYRGDDRWAVLRGLRVMDAEGRTDHDFLPSSRTKAHLRRFRFTEAKALRIAHKFAPSVTINGITPADLLAKYGIANGQESA